MRRHTAVFAVFLALLHTNAWTQEAAKTQEPAKKTSSQQDWGVGFTFRTSNIPFATDEKTVATLIPLIMFENDRFWFHEIEGGVKLFRSPQWRVSALGRAHYFDIPEQYQNQLQGDTIDWGLQLRYKPSELVFLDAEALSDWDGHSSFDVRLAKEFDRARWNILSGIRASYKTSHYNSYFWGLTQEHVGSGVDLGVGVNAYYHVISSFYLQAAARLTYLSAPVRKSSLVEDDFHGEAFLGFGFSDDKSKPRKAELRNTPYVRGGHGWATPSALADIIRFNAERDPGNNQLSTVFYGHPLTDTLFGLPIDIYFHTGFGWHWASSTQGDAQEVILAIKLFYTIPIPVRLRIGFAEGVSWVNTIPSVEENNLRKKGYEPSQLLNYLGPSLEMSLGDVLPWKSIDNLWLGYYIHHRSAIFESAQQFGRIKGGSNFQMVALKYHLW